jgi:hypothetical protein
MRHDVGLRRPRAVQRGAGDHLEVVIESEVFDDPLRGGLGLGGGHREPHSGRAKVGQQVGDSVEDAVDRPAPADVVGAVGGDGLVGPIAEPHRAQRVVHRRSDDAVGEVAVGHVGPDLAECVTEAGDDSVGGIGQRAVQVEDH